MSSLAWKNSPVSPEDNIISPVVTKLTPRNASSSKSSKHTQGRKSSHTGVNVSSPTYRDRNRGVMFPKVVRTLMGKRFIILGAAILAALSILMLVQTSRVARESSFLEGSAISKVDHSKLEESRNNSSLKHKDKDWQLQQDVQSSASKDPLLQVKADANSDDPKATSKANLLEDLTKPVSESALTGSQLLSAGHTPLLISYAPPLPLTHPCHKFTQPPPPYGRRKKSGFRPCPVCYLSVKKARAAEPLEGREEGLVLKHLTYATSSHPSEQLAASKGSPPKFGGYPTWEDRAESFKIRESMTVHCGFVWGERPGVGTGYNIAVRDRRAMEACTGIVVASAIFGAYDLLQQPTNISKHALKHVCFFMFVDDESWEDLESSGAITDQAGEAVEKVGVWRIVLVKNVPFEDPRRTGKIPKLLMHRLFPNARYSMWMDAKLQLVVDPYQIMERFLWRGNFTWAISKHYKRFDVFVEAEANKAAGKYSNDSIDAQIEVYQKDGLTPYSEAKLPIISDVPEGCLIIREHTPVTNLFACLWFNEVDRFTSRDQLSFGYTRDKILAQVPWRFSMFQDCERRNFVVQGYHKDVLREKLAGLGAPVDQLMQQVVVTKDGHLALPDLKKIGN